MKYLNLLWSKFKSSRYKKIYILLIIFLLLTYLPLFWQGGFVYDDWAVVKLSHECHNLPNSISCFWSGYPDRPLAALYYPLISNLFKTWAPGYFLLVVTAWLSGVGLLAGVLSRRFGMALALPFFLVAATPSIASTIIFSPAMQGIGAVAFLIWSLSFYLLDKFLVTGRRRQLLMSQGLLLASLLFYESSLPLFGLSALWPIIIFSGKLNKAFFKKYLKTHILPMILIVGLIITYQEFYVKQYYEYISKVRFLDANINLIAFGMRVVTNAIYIVTISVANMAAWALIKLQSYGLAMTTSFLLIIVLVRSVVSNLPTQQVKLSLKKRGYKLLGLALVLIMLGVSGLHFIAVQPPTVVGYNNRGVVAGAIVVAILVGLVWQRWLAKSHWLTILGVLFISCYSFSFLIQRHNYIEAQKQRLSLENKLVSQVEAVNQVGMTIIANTPTYTLKNFNNETIFSDEVLDFGNFLKIKANVKSIRGISISPARIVRKELVVQNGGLHIMTYDPELPLSLLWYYDTTNGRLSKVESLEQMQQIIDSNKQHFPYEYPTPVDVRGRNAIRNWLGSY